MRRRQKGADPPPPGSPLWMATFSDMITQVLAFFIMLFSFSSINQAKFQQVVASLQASFSVLPAGSSVVQQPFYPPGTNSDSKLKQGEEFSLTAVQKQLASELQEGQVKEYVQLEVGEKALIIHFDAALLFDSGRAVIRQEAIVALDAIGKVLAGLSNHIRVEGHTDSDPLLPTAQYPDNWMLSGARATGVLRFLHEFHGIPYTQMSIAGYADTRPVASNETPEGKAKNRRVDIVVLGR